MFDKLDRDGDGEISKLELEFGLKTINKNIITSQEVNFVDTVLEVSQAVAINFHMFAVISALSERVVGLDAVMKGLIDKTDYSALQYKLSKCIVSEK